MTVRWTGQTTLVDWLPVVALPVVFVVDVALSSRSVSVVGIAGAFVGCLPLVARRRVPFAVLLAPIIAGIILVTGTLHPASSVVAIPMVALFEAARRGSRRTAFWLAALTVPSVVVSIVWYVHGDATNFAQVLVRNVALCWLAIVAGELSRTRDEAAARAAQLLEQEGAARMSEERLRIARDVHDTIAHAMVAINVQTGVAAHLVDRDPAHAREALLEIKRTSGQALDDLRHTLGVLRRPDEVAPSAPTSRLEDLDGLVAGLRSAGLRVSLDVASPGPLSPAVHAAGYRIVQEALTNVLRHAGAASADVRVAAEDGALAIDVTDDGRGAARAVADGSGNGLRGMRERAAALGGAVECGPRPEGGWRVHATLPLGRAATA